MLYNSDLESIDRPTMMEGEVSGDTVVHIAILHQSPMVPTPGSHGVYSTAHRLCKEGCADR